MLQQHLNLLVPQALWFRERRLPQEMAKVVGLVFQYFVLFVQKNYCCGLQAVQGQNCTYSEDPHQLSPQGLYAWEVVERILCPHGPLFCYHSRKVP